ncbi:phosphatidylglycerol lysyltransferase domain-containing protein [uncultured Flavonifractor sp.]|uniref:phosphatidylglycerol lysyltransferase domain-containing protein n=1 Tax=uncultured Flavonifractor sp. TaxID=1193534 RepID=UPI00261B53F5|nr:phosphatidylglycerol lysyltransferase domain-containing protein [uncultured Flavonifractor sp.]
MLDTMQQRCRPIQLEDRPIIDEIRAKTGHTLSAHAFTSLYLWQNALKLSVCLEGDAFFIRFLLRGENAWFYPCGSEEAQIRFLQMGLECQDFSLHYVRQEDMDFIQRHFPGRFRFEEARGDCEYICGRREQVEMPGGKFRKLRSKVNRGKNCCQWNTLKICRENLAACRSIIENWEHSGVSDREVALFSLECFEELDMMGIILESEDGPQAVAYGSYIAEDTFDLHVAKTIMNNIDSYLKWKLYSLLPETVQWINLEEDLNIPGLRTSKLESVPELILLWKGYPV